MLPSSRSGNAQIDRKSESRAAWDTAKGIDGDFFEPKSPVFRAQRELPSKPFAAEMVRTEGGGDYLRYFLTHLAKVAGLALSYSFSRS